MNIAQRTTRLLSAAVIASAIAVPTASARPAGHDAPSSARPVAIESAPPVVQRLDEGFDWASAAIGAGAAGGLALLLGVGGGTYHLRHRHAGTAHQA